MGPGWLVRRCRRGRRVGQHVQALLDMGPSTDELDEAIAWVNDRYTGGRYPGIDDVRRFIEDRL